MSDVEVSVRIPAGDVVLEADVVVPRPAHGIVLFAHGSGSGRHSPRNRFVARELQRAGLATVLADLLTREEERTDAVTGRMRFDIGLLAERVAALVDWLPEDEFARGLRVGLFGASTGAAAALVCAATRPDVVTAVVSRGGRPDLAGEFLRLVHQPTLLIVGERDPIVIELNREAMDKLVGEARLEIIPGASHLFEEPGALEAVAGLARDWFLRHLGDHTGTESR
ncbi:dienelactone hydrolase family protein [Planotetraspora sp. A-T 1434]|uniref:dienelactone hydrolase family protein n=1 Tax=Planotetraspora sp. A-T 1434 TaxID=2979219 RepID=UPI0021BFD70B|nr:alpha/beta family hydrolase [Planotetraspora sp. A-T 1434]MCT9934353.1 dienelactone hydrolase family protein [Planotetraspora sp. A-T 1434]